jgi:hypothetical protein
MNLSDTKQIAQVHWDIAKLLEFGVSPEFVGMLDDDEIRDLLKGILYLNAKYPSLENADFLDSCS